MTTDKMAETMVELADHAMLYEAGPVSDESGFAVWRTAQGDTALFWRGRRVNRLFHRGAPGVWVSWPMSAVVREALDGGCPEYPDRPEPEPLPGRTGSARRTAAVKTAKTAKTGKTAKTTKKKGKGTGKW